MAQENTFGLGPLDQAVADWQNANKGLGQPLQDSDRGIAAGQDDRNPSLPQMPRVNAGQQDVDTDPQQPGLPGMAQAPAGKSRGSSSLLPPQPLVPMFEAAARKYQVPVNVLMALAQQESSYDPYIRGPETQWGRAKGMMQYLDSTAKMMGINPYDAEQSVDAAAKQLKERLDKGYSMDDAVKEHFAGPDRKLWGPKTAAYGASVLKKARAIGSDLYPDQQAAAPEQQDPNANNFGTWLPRDQYEAAFKSMNPTAPPEMLQQAMQGWDEANKARMEQQANAPKAGFDRMLSPQATFDANLDKKLQGKQKGVVPQLPGRMDNAAEAQRKAAEDAAAERETQLEAAGSYLKQSLKAGMYDLAGAGAKVLDEINPWTLSPGDAAVLFKDDPEKLKSYQDQSLAMVLSRFSKAMTKNSEHEMEGISPRAKRDYASKEYATLDADKSALMAPTRVIGDALRSLPSSIAMAVSVYLTRGAATQAEAQALKAGMTAEAARQAGIQAGAKMMGTAGAASEGAIGYAQQALQSSRDVEKMSDAEIVKSPVYQQLLQEGFTPAAARAKLAADVGEQAGQIAGIVDATVNKVGGEFLGKVLTEGGKFVPRVMKGFANEAATETAQSAGEQVGQNIATRQNVNPDQSLGEGVGEAMAQGAAVGGLMGGTMAGIGGRGHVEGFEPDKSAPSAPSGPLGRAAQAGEQAAQARRVTVQTPQGNLNGFLDSYQAGEGGQFVARVLGDDGQIYQFTQDDQVIVRPEGAQQPAALPAPTITVTGGGTAMTTDQRQQVAEQRAAREQADQQRREQLGLTSDVERAAAAHNERTNLPDTIADGSTVSVTTRDGEVIDGTVQNYQRTDSSANLEVKDAQGETWHFKEGDFSDVTVREKNDGAVRDDGARGAEDTGGDKVSKQEASPQAAEVPAQGGADAAAKPEQGVRDGLPAATEASDADAPVKKGKAEKQAEPNYDDMSAEDLYSRLEYLSKQAVNNRGWERHMVREKKKINAALARKAPAELAPAPVVDLAGIASRSDANSAMLKAAEQTGKPHEVVEREQDGKTVYDVRPLAEQSMQEPAAPTVSRDQGGVQPTETSTTTPQGRPLVVFQTEDGQRVMVRKDQFEQGVEALPTFGENGNGTGKRISRDALRSLVESTPSNKQRSSDGSEKGSTGARTGQAPALQGVEQRQGSVQQPEQSVLPQLRGAGDSNTRGVDGELSGVPAGRRGAADAAAHAGSEGQQRQLRAGERDLGDEARAGQQPAQKRDADGQRQDAESRRVGARDGAGAEHAALSQDEGDERQRRGADAAPRGQEEGGVAGSSVARSGAKIAPRSKFAVGDTIVADGDIGYLKAGEPKRITRIDPNGRIHFENPATREGASISPPEIAKAQRRGIILSKQEAEPAAPRALENGTAPEHVTTGVDDRELGQIVEEFNGAQAEMMQGEHPVSNIFQPPAKNDVVRLADKVKVYNKEHGWMTPAEAKAKIAEWKAAAEAQYADPTIRSANNDKVVLSLFDYTGEWSKPWEEAGYQVYRFDIQNDPEMGDVNNFSTDFFGDWFGDFDGQPVYAILAACPCTDFASSGARHFAAKDADGRTVASVKLVHQTLRTIEYFKPAVWALENPVGRIESLGGLPPWRLSFDPNALGDPYTKKTLIWGRFNGDLPIAPVEPTEGSKMHSQYGGKSQATKNARSVTPEGFSYGFFMANNAHDHPAMAIANTFDRLDRGLIEQAVAAGVTEAQITDAVEDHYYMDMDDEAANQAIRDLIPTEPQPVTEAPKAADRFAGNKLFTQSAVDKARARLKSKMGQLNSGIDPEMLADGITIAGAYIESGVRDFNQYAQAMVSDLGEAVKPYLLSFYEGVRNWPGLDNKGMTKAKEARRLHAELLKQEPKEAQNDTQTASPDAGTGAKRPSTEGQGPDAGQRRAGAVPRQPDLLDNAVDERSEGADRGAGSEPAAAVPKRGNAGADAELRLQGSRGDSAGAGDRADRQPGQPVTAARNHRISDGDLKREGSWKATAARNVDVIELVKRLETEGRIATPEEKAQMAKFTGWGASEIANGIFPNQYGQYKEGWREVGERLKAALTPEEYDQARRTTQYAHYTSEGVIRSIYNGLARLGFKGGSILEPGMGVGHFNGLMPAAMAASSNYTGVEYDGLTGAIAKHLYPESNIIVGDYTKTSLPKNFFDAAIGNPPFASTKITNDPEYKKQGFMLHDYFFAKTIDRVKPGGVVVFVTSKGTMDKGNSSARQYLAERANLLGAVRLPQTAFKDNAGTEVVTDVLFLQKRGPGVADNGVKWLGTKDVKTDKGADTPVNEYFADHPEMVLGTHSQAGSMYRANEYTVLPREGDIEQHFADALASLPENVYRPERGSAAERAIVMDRDFNPRNKKEGGLYVGDDGRLMQVEDGTGVEAINRINSSGKAIALKPSEKVWLKRYISVRDALKQAQYDQLTDGDWEKSLADLNSAYDAFVKEHGPVLAFSTIERQNPDGTISESKRFKNKPLFELDAEGALAYALEKIREDGTIEKGVVMRERVLRRDLPPQIKTTSDAMFVSLNNLGRLDIDDVARLAGTSREDAISALGNAIYEDPSAGWQQADAYLSGNVRRKLEEARAASDINPRFKRNVEALTAVQPRSLSPSEITVRAGANWVPTSDYEAFAKDVLGEGMKVAYTQQTGDWTVTGKEGNTSSEWATTKMTAPAIFDAVLNSRQIRITYLDENKKTQVDAVETEKANDIARKMRERFSRWVWQDADRAARLSDYYNEHFNNIAPRQYDGNHLTLPGVSLRFNLYPHQKRAIWRNIQDGDTYLAHSVGAGKTFTMIAAGMEQRRLGLVKRPWFVVPNHMLAQFSREFLELYPSANIMVADEQNFHTGNRRRFLAQAALNDPDAVVLTHSAFGRVGMSEEYTRDYITRQIDEWQATLDDVDESERITRKQIERRIEQLERRLDAKAGTEKKDAVMSFEETGADYLFVDEAHEFRKLDFATNQGNIKGIDPSGSMRAMDLQMKVEYLRSKNPGRSITMASGTPVTNTMGELYTVQRFMAPQQMHEDGLDTFDAWAAQYGDTVTALEQNAAGGYEAVTRFAKFQNVPELMRRVRSFMDILTSSNLGNLVKRPDVEGGARKIVVTPSPEGYSAYQKELEARIKAIRARKGPPKPGDDIILKVIADGRFSAIDMRFVNPALPSDPNSKLNTMLDDLVEAYRQTADNEYVDTASGRPDTLKGSTLLVFSDIGLGEQSAKTRGFDMKAWIMKRLADAGIPAEHVAFIRDYKQHAKKERLFADLREGKKRILIGGKDMETGVNVQKRLTHLFHLDAPWFPSSVEQREGRGVRQGNQNEEVSLRAYATKGSYDSTMWGMNARKARFIEQAMNGDDSVRSLDDVSEASSFEMASALASGDERYLKLAGLRGDVERLYRLKQGHYDQQAKMRQDRSWAQSRIERFERLSDEFSDAIKQREPIVAGEFSAKLGKTEFDNREEFSKGLFDAFKELASGHLNGRRKLGSIGGFDIAFYGKGTEKNYFADVHVDVPDSSPILAYPLDPDMAIGGIATRAANQVNGLDGRLKHAKDEIEAAKKQVEQASKRMGAPFPEEAELIEKQAQLNDLENELESEKVTADVAAAAPAVEENQAEPGEGGRFSVTPQTETPAFREWFGKSKMIDGDGKPQRMYHITSSDFSQFKPGGQTPEMSGPAIWLTPYRDEQPAAHNTRGNIGGFVEGTSVMPLYVKMENPLWITDREELAEAKEKFENEGGGFPRMISQKSMDAMKAAGFDGIYYADPRAFEAPNLETGKGVEVIVFDPEQVKSAIGNSGAFDPSNSDIRYSVAVDGARVKTGPAGVASLRTQAPLEIRSTAEQRTADKTDLRNRMFDELAAQRDVMLGHPDVGPIEITQKGIAKSRANAADRAKLLTMPHLSDIISDGTYLGSKPAEGKGSGIAAYHHIARRVTVDGVPLTALVTLEENADGRVQYYNHTMANDVPGAASTKTGQVDGELASYRRPDFHPDQIKTKPEALEARHAAVRDALSSGVLGSVFERLMDSGRVTLHLTEDTLPRSVRPKGAAIQGYTDASGRMHLVAENLTPQTAQPVLLHEAFHGGGEALAGQEGWQKLMKQLERFYAAAQQRKADGRNVEGDFWDEALRRVENAQAAGVNDPARAAEEFGAYAIENYELAPSGIKKWIDNVLGMIKDWLSRRFGIQLGALTPAQLRAFAVAALRTAQDTVPVTDSTLGGMAFNDGPMSVADKKGKAEALNTAINELDAPEPPQRGDFVGSAIRDMEGWRSMYSRFLAHPYHVASLYPEFTPVFQTATAQQQMRNEIIEDLHKDHRFYQDLPQESKASVNRVLELGRLTGNSWTAQAVKDGVRNPGYVYTVSYDDEGTPRRVRKDINAQLSEPGEVIKLNDAEAQAYERLRAMFDRALDLFRDQALREFGMDQYIGKPDAAKAIMEATKGFDDNAEARRMQNIAQFINDIEQAKRTGYVPFSRYGDYVVAVKERQADIQYFKDEGYGGYIARGVPEYLDEFLDRAGAQYDAAEQGWRLTEAQRRMLEDENEATVYSEKVETGLRDMFGRNSERNVKARQGSVSDIPSVQKAIDRILAEHVGDNENRRIVSFATSKKAAEGAGIDMTSLDALAEVAMLDPATWESVRGQLAKAIQAGGFRKHFFQSSNVPGYSADFERSMADYVVGLSGYLARRAHNEQWDRSIGDIKGEKLHRYASKYRDYVNQPAEEMALLRQTGFFMYLAGNISTAILNATQVPLMTMPFLTMITNHPMAAAETTRAYKDALAMFRTTKKTGYDLFDFDAAPADIKDDLIRARDEGLLLPLQSLEIMGIAGRRSVEGRALQKGYDQTVQTLALPFTATERLNRLVTFIAANRLARKAGVQERIRKTFRNNPLAQSAFGGSNFSPYAFGEFAVDETQFRMGKGNRPTAMRGVGTAIMQFKSFMLQFLEAMYRNYSLHGPRGKLATAATLGMLVALSGVWGAPGAEDLRKLFEGMYKGITKKDLDVRTSLRKMIYDAFGSSWLAGLVDGGLPYTAGADMSRRVGMGNIMPDARKATGIDWLDSLISFGGVPADLMIGRPLRAAQQLGRGDVGGAVTQFTPNFVDNARKAYNWQTDGVRTASGRMVLPASEVKPSSVAMKTIGVQPSQVSDVYSYNEAQRRQQSSADELKRQYTSDYVRALAALNRNRDPERTADLQAEVSKIAGEIRDYNAKAAPQDRINITRSTIKTQLQREMGGTAAGKGKERKAARGAAANLREVYGQ